METYSPPPENGRGRRAGCNYAGGQVNRRPNNRNAAIVNVPSGFDKRFERYLAWLRFADSVLAVLEVLPRRAFWLLRQRRDKIETEVQRLTTTELASSNNDGAEGDHDGK